MLLTEALTRLLSGNEESACRETRCTDLDRLTGDT